jgi:hypothetical protein
VGPGPGGVVVDVLRQPAVALGDRAVVHVVAEVRDEERDGRQVRVVVRHRGQRLVGRRRYVAEVGPRAVFARVVPLVATGVSRAREVFGVAGEGVPGRDEFAGEARHVEHERAVVVVHALGAAGEQRKVVRLARMRLGVHVGQGRPRPGQCREVGRLAHDVLLVLVLEHHDHHVVRAVPQRSGRRRRSGRLGRCSRRGLPRAARSRGDEADHQASDPELGHSPHGRDAMPGRLVTPAGAG